MNKIPKGPGSEFEQRGTVLKGLIAKFNELIKSFLIKSSIEKLAISSASFSKGMT